MKKRTIPFKKIIVAVLVIVIFSLCACFCYLKFNPSIAVLGYHGIYDEVIEGSSDNQFVMDKDKFEHQMKYLYTHGYKTLTLDEFYAWKKGDVEYGKKTVLITFDDGYYSNYKYAFDILKKYDFKASVFFVGSYALAAGDDNSVYLSYEDIERCKQEYPNIEFASHSFDMHGDKNVTNMTDKEIKDDIQRFKEKYDTKYIAYPKGLYTWDFIDSLKEEKFKMGFGFGPVHKKAKRSDDDFIVPRLNMDASMPMWKFILRINMIE